MPTPQPMNLSPEPQLQPLGLTTVETTTGATWVLDFRDRRPPHEIQFALERDLMVLFTPAMDYGRLTLRAHAGLVGAAYAFELSFEAALPRRNCYSLRVQTSWDEQPRTNNDYYRKTSESWFRFWTRGFTGAQPPAEDAGPPALYQQLCSEALQAAGNPGTIPGLRQTIIAAMKHGACFATSHKEGDTRLSWRDGTFVRTDSGEYPAHRKFCSEDEFLTSLRQFYDLEIPKHIHPGSASELTAWKLILRLLQTK